MNQILLIIFIVGIVLLLLKSQRTESRNQRNETKRCSSCGAVIPYTAKVCPVCFRGINGRSLGTDWKAECRLFRKSFDFKIMVFVIVVMAVCVGLMWLIS